MLAYAFEGEAAELAPIDEDIEERKPG